jgi:hypothetical protein
MSTINITHPDGTKGAYTITNPATWAAIQAIKPAKPPKSKPAKRKYPDWRADMTTREYIDAYFALNCRGRVGEVNAYDDDQDHSALYACANMDSAPTWAPDTVTVEIDA